MARFKVALVALDEQLSHDEAMPPDWIAESLAKEGIDFVLRECTTQEELAQHAGDADVVWVFGGRPVVTAESLKVIPRCGAIIRTGSGTDNIPVDEATQLGIVVANTPEGVSDEVSDHALGLLLAVVRQIAVQDRAVRSGKWDFTLGRPRWHIRGQTLGLIGFGHIARTVVRKVSGFDMTILAYDPYVNAETMAKEGVRPMGLDDVLSQSDFVSVHCPLVKDTYHLIGERELGLMKSTSILINTSRGSVIDEPALVSALTEGSIAAAGLDVFEQEPPDPDNPLFKLDNVVVTPHIAGWSDQHMEAFWRLSYETVIALASGHWPRSCVNPQLKLSGVNLNVKPHWNLTPD